MDNDKVQRPRLSWQQFVETMPRNKAPQISDIIERWSTRDEKRNVSNEDGEARMYYAFVTGLMEDEESKYLGMLTMRMDQLVTLGVVPAVRDRIERANLLLDIVSGLQDRLNVVESEVAALQIQGGAQ